MACAMPNLRLHSQLQDIVVLHKEWRKSTEDTRVNRRNLSFSAITSDIEDTKPRPRHQTHNFFKIIQSSLKSLVVLYAEREKGIKI